MPGLDRTGPNGEGSKTGRGLGKCNPETKDSANDAQNDNFPGWGRRFRAGFGRGNGSGQGRGLGRGLGRGFGRGRGQGRS
ncbi:MAG: DUF5320 domain-containing protein [Bacteroidales bacterium]|nr:DUF5320 domain-containing protein [Bacteroidales bacterium]